jgi:hypothetical protein
VGDQAVSQKLSSRAKVAAATAVEGPASLSALQ